jgi:hypothetical protein
MAFPESVVSLLPSVQNNLCIKVADFGLACSNPIQNIVCIEKLCVSIASLMGMLEAFLKLDRHSHQSPAPSFFLLLHSQSIGDVTPH